MSTVRALEDSTWPLFAELVEKSDGYPSWCWWMAFHAEGVGKDTNPDLNRLRKMERVS